MMFENFLEKKIQRLSAAAAICREIRVEREIRDEREIRVETPAGVGE